MVKRSPFLFCLLMCFGLALGAASSAAAVPLVDLEAGARYWAPSPSGDLNYEGDNLDLEDNLDFDREEAPNAYVRAKLPMFMIDGHYTYLDYSGDGKGFTTPTRFGEIDLSDYADISTETTVDMFHLGLMFAPSLPTIDFGLGVGANYISAEADIKADGNSESVTADAVLPVVKGFLRFSPPIVGLDLTVAGEGVTYSGNYLIDVRGTAGYTLLDFALGELKLEGGYRHIAIDYDEEDLILDTRFSGPFAGLNLTF